MDADGQILGCCSDYSADVRLTPEPQAPPEHPASGKSLTYQPSAAVSSGDLGCLVEEDTGVENLKDFWMGKPNCVEVLLGQPCKKAR